MVINKGGEHWELRGMQKLCGEVASYMTCSERNRFIEHVLGSIGEKRTLAQVLPAKYRLIREYIRKVMRKFIPC